VCEGTYVVKSETGEKKKTNKLERSVSVAAATWTAVGVTDEKKNIYNYNNDYFNNNNKIR